MGLGMYLYFRHRAKAQRRKYEQQFEELNERASGSPFCCDCCDYCCNCTLDDSAVRYQKVGCEYDYDLCEADFVKLPAGDSLLYERVEAKVRPAVRSEVRSV